MEDIIIKLHIAVIRFVQDRADSFARGREEGFTTAELLGNAALAIGALALIWGFFQTTLLTKIEDFMVSKLHL